MTQHHDPTTLLEEASRDLQPDIDRLVAGGISRGRTLRRRQRVGTALAAMAVFGVISLAASLVPHGGDQRTPVAGDPTPSVTPSVSPSPTPASGPVTGVAVSAQEVPATVERLLGRQGAGPLRTAPPYGAVSEAQRLLAHFSWQGTLASVIVEGFAGDGRQACQQATGPTYVCTTDAAGDPVLQWGPTTGDGVAAQGTTVWRDGFEVSALSYDAADGKSSTPLFAEPPLTRDDLMTLATSDAWFRR
ncbi:MAG: hypothetical protein ACXVEC_14670 [Nocardioides sp.]